MIDELRRRIDMTRTADCKHPKAVEDKLIFLHCHQCKWILTNNTLSVLVEIIKDPNVIYSSSYMTEEGIDIGRCKIHVTR